MFQALKPMLAERSLHLMLSLGQDGNIVLFVQPVKRHDKEDDAFTVPFRVTRDAADLDQNLAGLLTQWIERRAPMVQQLGNELAEFEQQQKSAADAAKKKLAEKNKKPVIGSAPTAKTTPAKTVTPTVAAPVMPSLFDAPAATAPTVPAPAVASAQAAEGDGTGDEEHGDDELDGDELGGDGNGGDEAGDEEAAGCAVITPSIATECAQPDFF